MTPKKVPTNDLDRAIVALTKSKSALPRLMRHLGEGELWFLIPHHPELDGGEIELEEGMASPFAELRDAKGPLVPIYSSFARAREALRTAKVPPRTFDAASMPARQLLEVLSKMEMRVVLNRYCKTGEAGLPLDLMRDVADGSAFDAAELGSGEATQFRLQVIDPADYPTKLLQPVFEILRLHGQFRAGWVFEKKEATPTPMGGRSFLFVIHMEPRDTDVFHEFNLVLNSACGKEDEVECSIAEESDPAYLAGLWEAAQPFYVAAGHER